MTFCLYECLRTVGLQGHYARFTSAGVHRAAHLSALTMEDYPILGIRSMEDRTRLFHLVQILKTLDLESLKYEDDGDDDYNGDEDYAAANSSFTYIYGDPDEDVHDTEDEKGPAVRKLNAASISKPSCVRRQLDFSSETMDHHLKQSSHPVRSVHVYANHNRINEPGQDKGSALPLQLDFDTGSAVLYSSRGNNHRPGVHSHQSDHCTGANTKTDIMEGISMFKPRSATDISKKISSKPVGHKDRKGISRKKEPFTEISHNRASEHTSKPTPVYESDRTTGYNYGLPLSSPPAPNKKQAEGQRISVCVRKRPLTHRECRRETDVVTTPSGECVIVHESKEAVDLTEYILQHRFYFDQVFGEESSNEEVYQRTAYPLVQHMLNGGKATCFAYGQTGAGKTHTMLGSSPGRPGLYALAVRDIFAHLSSTHTHSLVYVSFFEIYCGQLYDLLDHRKRLFAREDGHKVVHIAGLRDVKVDSVSSLLEVIAQGTDERTQGTSGVNPLSSRSHALLQIQLRAPNQQMAGRMWFVDLAGSERASDTKEPDRQSRMEGAEINQSLLALKECIRSLDQEQSHTPFRQSKLTQVLKDSFVGDSMTCMIANISPGHLATEHTLNTLRYADRVKELRGQGGLRGGRRGKTIPSPKRNLFNSTSGGGSSVGTRGKSPPKKPKLGRQREAFGPTTPTTRLATQTTVLCSTPKNSTWGEETSTRARKGIGHEQITPVRGLLGIGDKREGEERASGREGRKRDRYGGADSAGHSFDDQSVENGLVLGQVRDEQLHAWAVERESGFYHRKKENQQNTLKGERKGEKRQVEQRRQVESSTDTYSAVERERDLQMVDERDKERHRHLRWYHQQLQQFMPSPASSSAHLFSPSTHLSFSSSNRASLSSSVSPSSCPSPRHSAEVRAGGNSGQLSFVSSGEICLQSGASPSYTDNKLDEVCHGDSGGIGEDLRVSWEENEATFGQDISKNKKRKSVKAAGQVRRKERRPGGMEGGGDSRWVWVTTKEKEQADGVTDVRTADVEALMYHNCDSEERREVSEERQDASDVPAHGVWSVEEREIDDGNGLVSTHRNDDSYAHFNHPPVESAHQRAPAERPLSPACEHTSTLLVPNKLCDFSLKLNHTRCPSNTLPLPLQNVQQRVPVSSHIETEPCFAANANHTSVKAKMSVLAQENNSTDSLSHTMDPLSISLLQVDQQVATASFLKGEQNNSSHRPLEIETGEDNRQDMDKEHLTCGGMRGNDAEDEDVEFHLSFLKLPQAKTHCAPTSDTLIASNTERRKEMRGATYKSCGIGMMKHPLSEVMPVSLQDQANNQKLKTTQVIEGLGNKSPASPPKRSTCAPMQTFIMQSISPSVYHSRNAGSPSSHNLTTNGATQMPPEYAQNVHNKLAFSISSPFSKSVLGHGKTLPKQCHAVHSSHSSHSNIPLQPNSLTVSNTKESTSNQQFRPIIHLSTLDNLDHSHCRVVQAHWEQLEEMEALCRKEGTLLCQQPDMAFGDYVHKLEEIMKRKAQCVNSMIAQLQQYLKPRHSNQLYNQGEDNHDPIT